MRNSTRTLAILSVVGVIMAGAHSAQALVIDYAPILTALELEAPAVAAVGIGIFAVIFGIVLVKRVFMVLAGRGR